ncbi:MAG: hypothetical protein ACI82G_000910 [Bradymonadia bacterium]|jgi:hypothetical protein
MTAYKNRPSDLGAPGVYGYQLSSGFAGLFVRKNVDPSNADFEVLQPAKLESDTSYSLMLFCSDAPQVLAQYECAGECFVGAVLVSQGSTGTGYATLASVPDDLTDTNVVAQPNGIGDLCSVNINDTGAAPAYHAILKVPKGMLYLAEADGAAIPVHGFVSFNCASPYPAGEAYGAHVDGQVTTYHMPIVLGAKSYTDEIKANNNLITYGAITYRVVGCFDVD